MSILTVDITASTSVVGDKLVKIDNIIISNSLLMDREMPILCSIPNNFWQDCGDPYLLKLSSL